jgi:hypothetical protein
MKHGGLFGYNVQQGAGRPGQSLHLDFLPLAVANERVLVDAAVRVPVRRYYLSAADDLCLCVCLRLRVCLSTNLSCC